MPQIPAQLASEILPRLQSSGADVLARLLPQVYDELRCLAHHYLRGERSNHTLQSTALVHEAYLRFAKQGAGNIKNRNHFVAISAQLMRQILVEYGRSRRAAKRNGGKRVLLESAFDLGAGQSMDVVSLDEALKELATFDEQQSRIVELRFFGGLSIEGTAQVLGISPATVKRDWATARVWLHRELSKAPPK